MDDSTTYWPTTDLSHIHAHTIRMHHIKIVMPNDFDDACKTFVTESDAGITFMHNDLEVELSFEPGVVLHDTLKDLVPFTITMEKSVVQEAYARSCDMFAFLKALAKKRESFFVDFVGRGLAVERHTDAPGLIPETRVSKVPTTSPDTAPWGRSIHPQFFRTVYPYVFCVTALWRVSMKKASGSASKFHDSVFWASLVMTAHLMLEMDVSAMMDVYSDASYTALVESAYVFFCMHASTYTFQVLKLKDGRVVVSYFVLGPVAFEFSESAWIDSSPFIETTIQTIRSTRLSFRVEGLPIIKSAFSTDDLAPAMSGPTRVSTEPVTDSTPGPGPAGPTSVSGFKRARS